MWNDSVRQAASAMKAAAAATTTVKAAAAGGMATASTHLRVSGAYDRTG